MITASANPKPIPSIASGLVLASMQGTINALKSIDGVMDTLGCLTSIHRVEGYIYLVSRSRDHFKVTIGELDTPTGRRLQVMEDVLIKSRLGQQAA